MKFIFITLFILGALIGLGEPVWLALIGISGGRIAFNTSNGAVRIVAIIASLAVLSAHFAGYKLYGSATIHDNRPLLDSPRELASIAEPNLIFSTDSTRFEVNGFTFTPALLALPIENLRSLFNRTSQPILIQADPSSPSGLVVQRRCDYPCGNTFFPTLFPRRLPAYAKEDLGRYLAASKLATFNHPE